MSLIPDTTDGPDDFEKAVNLFLSHAHAQSGLQCSNNHRTLQQADLARQTLLGNLDEFNRRIHRNVAEINHERNKLVPIHHLPAELLATIFLYAQAGPLSKHLEILVVLGRVCKFWKRLIDGTPGIWGVASGSNSLQALVRVKAKLGGAPMDVEYHENSALVDLGTFIHTIVNTSEQWRSVDFKSLSLDALKPLEGRHFGNLQDLSLEAEYGSEDMSNLFVRQVQQIRHLNLRVFVIRWDWGLLHNLRSLELILLGDASPGVHEIKSVLLASPRLHTLELRGLTPVIPTDLLEDTGSIVHLEHLKDIYLDLTPAILRTLLKTIRIPNFMSCWLVSGQLQPSTPTSEEDSTLVNVLDPSMDHLIPPFRRAMAQAHATTAIMISQGTTRVHSISQTTTAIIALEQELNQKSIAWLSDLLHTIDGPPDVELIVEGAPTGDGDDAIVNAAIAIIQTASAVTKLRIDVTSDWTEVIVAALSVQIMVDGAPHWSLPNLKELAFVGGAMPPDGILAMLRMRYGRAAGAGPREGGSPSSGLPVLLSNLTCKVDAIGYYLSLMEDVVGEGTVHLFTESGLEGPHGTDDPEGEGNDGEGEGEGE